VPESLEGPMYDDDFVTLNYISARAPVSHGGPMYDDDFVTDILVTNLWCFTARQHKIGQFVPIYQGDYWLRRFRIANEEHTKHTVALIC